MPSGVELFASAAGVLLVIVIFVVVLRARKSALRDMDAIFEPLGLRPSGDTMNPRRGDVLTTARGYIGVYRGHQAGYTQGENAVTAVAVEIGGDLSTTIQNGSEFWVALGFNGPPFMVVERSEPRAPELAHIHPMSDLAATGDAVFDARFHVYCQDSQWSASVLDPDLRQRILTFPYVLLVQAHEQCFFSFFNEGANRTAAAYGSAYRWLDVLRRAETFLDLSVTVVQRMAAARPPDAPEPQEG